MTLQEKIDQLVNIYMPAGFGRARALEQLGGELLTLFETELEERGLKLPTEATDIYTEYYEIIDRHPVLLRFFKKQMSLNKNNTQEG